MHGQPNVKNCFVCLGCWDPWAVYAAFCKFIIEILCENYSLEDLWFVQLLHSSILVYVTHAVLINSWLFLCSSLNNAIIYDYKAKTLFWEEL